MDFRELTHGLLYNYPARQLIRNDCAWFRSLLLVIVLRIIKFPVKTDVKTGCI